MPPVSSSGPEVSAWKRLVFFTEPETGSPHILPSVKFHAQCIPIGSHKLPQCAYAAPNSTPASTAMATLVQSDALGLIMCAPPKSKAEKVIAAALPSERSVIRYIVPRKTHSSAAAVSRQYRNIQNRSDVGVNAVMRYPPRETLPPPPS